MTPDIDRLVAAVEELREPAARDTARALVRAVLELHRDALRRLMELTGPVSSSAAADPLVAAMLLLHDLHPVDLETRIRRTLAELPRAELIDLREGVVRVRAREPELARERLLAAAPDAAAIEVIAEEELVPAARLLGGMK